MNTRTNTERHRHLDTATVASAVCDGVIENAATAAASRSSQRWNQAEGTTSVVDFV